MADWRRSPSGGHGVLADRATSNRVCKTMPGPERKVKLPPDLSVARPSAPSMESLTRQERVLGSIAQPVEGNPGVPRIAPEPSAGGGSAAPEPPDLDSAAADRIASKQALAADLAGMIEGMLRDTQFATAATTRTRNWTRQIGEVAARDASTDESAFTNSLVADLAEARPAAAAVVSRPKAPRRWWVDAILVLACLLSVLSAGYFTFAP